MERRGQVIRVPIMLVNWQQEEPTDCGEGRQLFMDDTSRVSREAQARFREGLGVQFPGATRPSTDARSQGFSNTRRLSTGNLLLSAQPAFMKDQFGTQDTDRRSLRSRTAVHRREAGSAVVRLMRYAHTLGGLVPSALAALRQGERGADVLDG